MGHPLKDTDQLKSLLRREMPAGPDTLLALRHIRMTKQKKDTWSQKSEGGWRRRTALQPKGKNRYC